MKNLSELGLRQPDRQRYKDLSRNGVMRYRHNYFSGTAQDPSDKGPRGIAADDFTIFATQVYFLADNRPKLDAIRENKGPIVHIDIGPGPSYASFIASLPYADKQVAVDISPENVNSLNGPIEPYWKSWLEIAEMLFDIRHPNLLVNFDNFYPGLYDKLRLWPTFTDDEKESYSTKIYSHIFHLRGNPYRKLKKTDLQEALTSKLEPREGDVLDDVDTVKDLEKRARIITKAFVSESVGNSPEMVGHLETNSIGMAAPECLWINGHITEADGYNGLLTPEEIAANPKKLVEFPGSPGFFQAMNEKLVSLTPRYNKLWQRLAYSTPDRRMVRPEASYGHAAIFCGEVPDTPRYQSGPELVRDMPEARKVSIQRPGREPQVIYCVEGETPETPMLYNRHRGRKPQQIYSRGSEVSQYATRLSYELR